MALSLALNPWFTTLAENCLVTPIIAALPKLESVTSVFATHPRLPRGPRFLLTRYPMRIGALSERSESRHSAILRGADERFKCCDLPS
jgi:hypothetical protein